jgi:hypothetical protein
MEDMREEDVDSRMVSASEDADDDAREEPEIDEARLEFVHPPSEPDLEDGAGAISCLNEPQWMSVTVVYSSKISRSCDRTSLALGRMCAFLLSMVRTSIRICGIATNSSCSNADAEFSRSFIHDSILSMLA